jgi:hypothetical protein
LATQSANGSILTGTAATTLSKWRHAVSEVPALTTPAECLSISTIRASSRRRFSSTWNEENCPETNNHIVVGKEDYMLSGDGFLMPTKKGQAPPDLRYFK